MNNNIIGRMTCPICNEPLQDLKVNVNHKLYVFCDNGCSVKLNAAKSKRYLPVLLSGQDIRDEKLGLIISSCKGNKQNEIIKKKEVHNAGDLTGSNDNTGTTGSSTGSLAGSNSSTGTTGSSTGSHTFGRTDGQYSARRTSASHDSILGRAAAWLAADDDE